MNRNLIISLIVIIMLCSNSLAWMEETHEYESNQAVDIAKDSAEGKLVSENMNDYVVCNTLADISVLRYLDTDFRTIGKDYKATHNMNFCKRMIQLADSSAYGDDASKVCALGACTHQFQDNPSHNGLVETMILKMNLPNPIIHALTEEAVNDQILAKPGYHSIFGAVIEEKAAQHRQLFIDALTSESSTNVIDVANMYDTFVDQVKTSTKTVTFKGFTAIPLMVHLLLLGIFVLNVVLFTFLFKKIKAKEQLNLFAKILTGLSVLAILVVIVVYVAFAMGQIWYLFEFISTPVTAILPVTNQESYVNQAISDTAKMLQNGPYWMIENARDPITGREVDPSGAANLQAADASINGGLMAIFVLMLAGIGLLIYLSFKKKN